MEVKVIRGEYRFVSGQLTWIVDGNNMAIQECRTKIVLSAASSVQRNSYRLCTSLHDDKRDDLQHTLRTLNEWKLEIKIK